MVKVLVKDSSVKVRVRQKPYSSEDFFCKGIIILNKPSGPRCRDVVNSIKNLLEVGHAGHAGTLDPKVTGVLPIGLEKATKVLGYLSVYPKTYEGAMHLHGDITERKLLSNVKKFTGKIQQLPPRISAVKRAIRTREVYAFDILNKQNRDVFYRIKCEAGTYIRKICHDLGESLGTGAHMTQLNRIQSGPFTLKDAVDLDKVIRFYKKYIQTKNTIWLRKFIKPVEIITKNMSKVWIDPLAVKTVTLGSPVFSPGVLQLTDNIKKGIPTAILDINNHLVAIGHAQMNSTQILKNDKGLAVKTDSVLAIRN